MRSIKVVRNKLKTYEQNVKEVSKALEGKDFEGATMYQRAVINALRWVLGELEDV